MILKFLLIFILINVTKCDTYTKKDYALNAALEHTVSLFEKLKLDYASEKLNNNILNKINNEITEHINDASKIISIRHKREISKNSDGGVNVLNGLQDFNELNFDGVQDINFFSLQYGLETIWFTVVLNTSQVSLYQITNGIFYEIGAYPLMNGTQIIVSSCAYGALLIVQNQNGSVLILSFNKVLDSYYLQPIQDFELIDMTHLTVWNGMNQLYLGIASHSNISIFTWFGNYFDLMQVINIGTKKLIPFESKGFMYLAVTGYRTTIFKYFLKSNQFLIMQKLPSSQDVSYFQLREGHFMEHFLTLSKGSSTVIYKEVHGRFVPFQQIPSGKFTVPIILSKTIVLLTLHKDNIVTYQYNGWRFIKLNLKLSGISQFHKVILYGKELLLIKDKNNKWTLKKPLWIKMKSYKDLHEEIRIWNINAKKRVQRTVKIPDSKNPIKILKGHIGQLYVHNINDHNSQKLKRVSKQYKELVSKFRVQSVAMNNKWHLKNLTLASLHAKKIRVKCKPKCKVNRLNVKGNTNFLSKITTISNDTNQILNFKELNVKEIKNWKCPLLKIPIEDIIVQKSINGISLSYLQENALKVTGDQEVSGKHIFDSINATNVSMPLNIATHLTNQEVTMKEMKVKQLNLTAGGILLPLNGPPSTITGSIKTSKLKVKNSVYLRGKISGNGVKKFLPIIYISEPLDLDGDFALENVKIENLRSTDLTANKIGSVKNILSNAIFLHDNVPISLILSNEKVKWNNITLHGSQNWITTNFQNTSVISGKKHILHNVQITKSSYDNLKFPQIQTELCAASIIASEIRTSSLTAANITIKNLRSSQLFGNLGEKYFTDNSTVLFKPILSGKQYYHNVTAQSIFARQLNNLNLTELEKLVNSWIEPNTLNASIITTDLTTNILRSPVQFNIELPKPIKNMIVEQNAHVDNINNINLVDFLTNAIKLQDMISLQNITFRNGFSTKHIHTQYLPFSLIDTTKDFNFHKTRIFGNIKVDSINLPYSFKTIQNETPVNVIIKGLASFPFEPKIINVNNIQLEKLFPNIWLTSNMTELHGKNLHFENIAIKGNVTLNNLLSTLNLETWKNISKRVLSKTKLQEITAHAFLNTVEVPIIVGSNVSIIKSSLPDFNDMFKNVLVKNKNQEVNAKWSFNTLKISGKMNAKHTINNLNLKRDVMRHDSKENIVTGKKTVAILTAENLNSYNFNKWAANALMQSKKDVIIKGCKKFNTATFKDIKVSGTIMGHTIEKVLSKSTNQTVYGHKRIQGSINATELIINGLVNDVNLTKLMDHQLKKQKPLQIIKTRIELQTDLNIVGNLTVKDTYSGAEMKNFYKNYSNVVPILERTNKSLKAAEIINVALRNRAVYINKLEVVKDVINASNESNQIVQCKFGNLSSHCTSKPVMNFVLQTNTSDFILLKSIIVNKEEFIVLIKFDSVSIYLYSNLENKHIHLKDLHIAKIMDAFVEPGLHSLWIILRLISQTLVLHYQPWDDLQEYVLPVTEVFVLSRSPSDQLLLFLSDGVWNLEGLASPRNIIRISLKEKVETFVDGFNYYVKCTSKNDTTLMKARYIGN